MQVCPNCSHRNRPGVVFCENCGASLIGDSPLSTRSIGSAIKEAEAAAVNAQAKKATETAGSDIFEQGALLRIEVEGAEPLLLKPKQETIFGRRDPATGLMPDVDLTPFAGYRMGVSRRHAALRRNESNRLELWDLGSSNGTFLNGTRLDANKPYPVRDTDEIRLGQMTMHIYYQHVAAEGQSATSTSPAPAKPETPAAPQASPANPAAPTAEAKPADAPDAASKPPATPAPADNASASSTSIMSSKDLSGPPSQPPQPSQSSQTGTGSQS